MRFFCPLCKCLFVLQNACFLKKKCDLQKAFLHYAKLAKDQLLACCFKLILIRHYFDLNEKSNKKYSKICILDVVKRILWLGFFVVLFLGTELIYFEMGHHRDYCVSYWENFNTYTVEVSRTQTILITNAAAKLRDKQTI